MTRTVIQEAFSGHNPLSHEQASNHFARGFLACLVSTPIRNSNMQTRGLSKSRREHRGKSLVIGDCTRIALAQPRAQQVRDVLLCT